MLVEKQSLTAPDFDDVTSAAARIGALARDTPIATSRLFDQAAGGSCFFKCENLQRGGAFKIRGASNFMFSLTPEERKRGVVTFSSGNHAQAVAIAAAHSGVKATIVMPTDAPQAKLESTKLYDPEIVLYDRLRDDREALSHRIADETGAIVLPSYDHPLIIAGQGTAALELLRQQPELDTLLVPLGGGGLLSGTLLAARQMRPRLRVYGVEPARANDWYLSLESGSRQTIPAPDTLADGLRTPTPGAITFEIVRELGDGVLLVSEEEIKTTVRFLLSRMKFLVEPSGAVAAAAALHRKLPANSRRVGVILSGGNVDLPVLADICREA